MLNSPIISVAIGVVFLFAALATLTTAVTEAVAWLLGLRAKFLLRGLLALVDGDSDATGDQLRELLGAAVLSNQGSQGRINTDAVRMARDPMWSMQGMAAMRRVPSYIPARSFASAVLHWLLRDSNPADQDGARTAPSDPTMADVMAALRKKKEELKSKPSADGSIFYQQLESLAVSALGDVKEFRASIENWYDDHMDRVSGWYKRYTRWITAVVGAVIVVGLNVQLFAFASSLYNNQALSRAVVSKAIDATPCQDSNPSVCITKAREQVKTLEPVLNVGWVVVPACRNLPPATAGASARTPSCTFFERYGITSPPGGSGSDAWAVLLLLAGYLLTVFALVPGSRFWYDLLNQFGSLRSSGPKPAASPKT